MKEDMQEVGAAREDEVFGCGQGRNAGAIQDELFERSVWGICCGNP